MTGTADSEIKDKGLLFFGRISASVTHELNNVIAIIREYSGLMDDLLSVIEPGQPIDTEKFKRISDKIGGQTRRGESIIKRLNRFSHLIDAPVKTVNISHTLKDVTDLSQRFASMKAITLECRFPEEPAEVETNPFLLFQAVCICLDLSITDENQQSTVTVGYRTDGGTVTVSVRSSLVCDGEYFDGEMEILGRIMNKLSGSVTYEPQPGGGSEFRLTVPAK